MLLAVALLVLSPNSCQTNADCSAESYCTAGICTQSPAPKLKPARARKTVIPYVDGMEIPDGAKLVTKKRLDLWVTGTVLLAASWITTWGTTAFLCTAGCPGWAVPVSFVPIFGPIADAVISQPLVATFMITMAIIQAGGTALVFAGVFAPPRRYLIFTGNGVAGQF